MSPSTTLILADGTAMMYRAFFAIRELSTKAGKPTNAVFGFIRMLRQLGEVWKPSHWIVAFDGGLPQHRLALQQDYKAQRKPMPDALKAQMGDVADYLDAAGVPWIREAKQEADDVIASLASQASGHEGAVLIATGDKDMFQLVDDQVRIVPVSGKSMDTAMGADEVKAKTGVPPKLIVEWLALTGDASDNIPGVPGIGAKTAARLLGQFGSIDALCAHLDQVDSEKVREALKSHGEQIRTNLNMVRLRKDLDVTLDWSRTACRPPNPSTLRPFLEAMEFHSMVRELAEPMLF